MIKNYYLFIFILYSLFFTACTDNDNNEYIPISDVTVDLTKVPYGKLSDYHFFEGDIKNQKPVKDVLPYEPISSLFSDYAHKKRFVWMPKGTKATFNDDDKILELPVGAVLIKTFYYENVQNVTPLGSTKLIETRLMIRKSNGWIFADYVWNSEQTDATLDLSGSHVPVTWENENNIIKNVNYRIPTLVQCITCHKSTQLIGNEIKTTQIPIGIKPQNLNFDYTYSNETKNQLAKWVEYGYLDNNFIYPSEANTMINYNDTSKSLELRVRSYLDINCAHCHQDNRHCYYRPMRFDFKETGLPNGLGQTNIGVCVNTSDLHSFDASLNKIIKGRNAQNSMLYHRINTENEAYRMPLHGRTLIHEEAVEFIGQWINSLDSCN